MGQRGSWLSSSWRWYLTSGPSSLRPGLVTLPCDARARSMTPKQTLALVRAACHHRALETPGSAAGSAAAPDHHAATRLTARQRELLHLVAAGHTNAQIARRLGISEGTVRTHLKTSTACCRSPARCHP
jgi:hypothetical protein